MNSSKEESRILMDAPNYKFTKAEIQEAIKKLQNEAKEFYLKRNEIRYKRKIEKLYQLERSKKIFFNQEIEKEKLREELKDMVRQRISENYAIQQKYLESKKFKSYYEIDARSMGKYNTNLKNQYKGQNKIPRLSEFHLDDKDNSKSQDRNLRNEDHNQYFNNPYETPIGTKGTSYGLGKEFNNNSSEEIKNLLRELNAKCNYKSHNINELYKIIDNNQELSPSLLLNQEREPVRSEIKKELLIPPSIHKIDASKGFTLSPIKILKDINRKTPSDLYRENFPRQHKETQITEEGFQPKVQDYASLTDPIVKTSISTNVYQFQIRRERQPKYERCKTGFGRSKLNEGEYIVISISTSKFPMTEHKLNQFRKYVAKYHRAEKINKIINDKLKGAIK